MASYLTTPDTTNQGLFVVPAGDSSLTLDANSVGLFLVTTTDQVTSDASRAGLFVIAVMSAASLTGDGTLRATGARTAQVGANLSGPAGLSAGATAVYSAAVSFTVNGSLTSGAILVSTGAAALGGSSAFSAAGTVLPVTTLRGVGILTAIAWQTSRFRHVSATVDTRTIGTILIKASNSGVTRGLANAAYVGFAGIAADTAYPGLFVAFTGAPSIPDGNYPGLFAATPNGSVTPDATYLGLFVPTLLKLHVTTQQPLTGRANTTAQALVLNRLRIMMGAASAVGTMSTQILGRVIRFINALIQAQTAAGERPPRLVLTTAESDALAKVILSRFIASVTGTGRANASATGVLINTITINSAPANATMSGFLLPVRNLDGDLKADTSVIDAGIIVADKMTTVIRVIHQGVLFPNDPEKVAAANPITTSGEGDVVHVSEFVEAVEPDPIPVFAGTFARMRR